MNILHRLNADNAIHLDPPKFSNKQRLDTEHKSIAVIWGLRRVQAPLYILRSQGILGILVPRIFSAKIQDGG